MIPPICVPVVRGPACGGRGSQARTTVDAGARSLPLYPEAFACTERSGDQLFNEFLHNNAGCAALDAGDIPAARAHLEAAAHSAQQIGDQDPVVMLNLGAVLRAEGDPDGARSMFEAALRANRRNGSNSAAVLFRLPCRGRGAPSWPHSERWR